MHKHLKFKTSLLVFHRPFGALWPTGTVFRTRYNVTVDSSENLTNGQLTSIAWPKTQNGLGVFSRQLRPHKTLNISLSDQNNECQRHLHLGQEPKMAAIVNFAPYGVGGMGGWFGAGAGKHMLTSQVGGLATATMLAQMSSYKYRIGIGIGELATNALYSLHITQIWTWAFVVVACLFWPQLYKFRNRNKVAPKRIWRKSSTPFGGIFK